jgi:hypothetical protein
MNTIGDYELAHRLTTTLSMLSICEKRMDRHYPRTPRTIGERLMSIEFKLMVDMADKLYEILEVEDEIIDKLHEEVCDE